MSDQMNAPTQGMAQQSGMQGSMPPQGMQSSQGGMGMQGSQGMQGAQGGMGQQGMQGSQGATGATGGNSEMDSLGTLQLFYLSTALHYTPRAVVNSARVTPMLRTPLGTPPLMGR